MSPPLDPVQVFRRLPDLLRRRRERLGPPQVVLRLMVMTVLGTKGYERTLDEMKRQLGRVLGWKPSDDVPSASVLMRVRSGSTGTLRAVATFLASGANDSVVDLESRDEQDQPDPTQPILRVRLLRAVLPDGSIAVYLTSLTDAQQHPAQALIDLYAQRWRLETAFREMKIWHGLERFHARHVDGIAQEITAIMIFQLLASELEAQVRKQYPDAQPPPDPSDSTPRTLQRPNIRFSRRIVADSAINIIFSAASGQDLAEAFDYALYRIWRYRQKIKPDRSFPRRRKSPPRGWKPRGTKGKGRP